MDFQTQLQTAHAQMEEAQDAVQCAFVHLDEARAELVQAGHASRGVDEAAAKVQAKAHELQEKAGHLHRAANAILALHADARK